MSFFSSRQSQNGAANQPASYTLSSLCSCRYRPTPHRSILGLRFTYTFCIPYPTALPFLSQIRQRCCRPRWQAPHEPQRREAVISPRPPFPSSSKYTVLFHVSHHYHAHLGPIRCTWSPPTTHKGQYKKGVWGSRPVCGTSATRRPNPTISLLFSRARSANFCAPRSWVPTHLAVCVWYGIASRWDIARLGGWDTCEKGERLGFETS